MSDPLPSHGDSPTDAERPPRRPRYAGRNPRRFSEKYKEHQPERYADTVAKVVASGKTPAGTHRPIMVSEILEVLEPKPGDIAVDCTLGFGGHAQQILDRIMPGGRLIGLDADPIELPRTEIRLRDLGFGPEKFLAVRSNFAGLPQILARLEIVGADLILADLGVSSMQIDNPARGFSVKDEGPLDMRMNPQKGQPASSFLAQISKANLALLLEENADEPRAAVLAEALAGTTFRATSDLRRAIHQALPRLNPEDRALTLRRVFQAVRIAVNEEFSALETFLRFLPDCLKPGGRVAILTFHSGEDRRVKKSFQAGLREGRYAKVGPEIVRASPEEQRANPRSAPAKLRWAERAEG